jgi:hypothetical protein
LCCAPPSICGLVFQSGQNKCVQGCKYVDVQANLALFWYKLRLSSIRQTLIAGRPQQRRKTRRSFKTRSRFRLKSRVPVRVFDCVRRTARDACPIERVMTPTMHASVRTLLRSLKRLEVWSIEIMHEVAAEFRSPVMFNSIGKASCGILRSTHSIPLSRETALPDSANRHDMEFSASSGSCTSIIMHFNKTGF